MTEPRPNGATVSTAWRIVWFLAGALPTFGVFMLLASVDLGGPPMSGAGKYWAISLFFNDKGAALLHEVTRKNLPSGAEGEMPVRRHLAILVNGLVVSAPTINSAIRRHAQISGYQINDQKLDELVSVLRPGVAQALELCMLANSADDKAAMNDAIRIINSSSPEAVKALEDFPVGGKPPPTPRREAAGEQAPLYEVDILHRKGPGSASGFLSRIGYRWVKLGPSAMRQVGLDDSLTELWKEAAKFRGKAASLSINAKAPFEPKLWQGALFYSRERHDPNPPADAKEDEKEIEYFVLARNPEIDPATGKETPRIDGSYLVSAKKVPANFRGPTLQIEDFKEYLILGVLGVMVVLLMVGRRWLHLRWEFIAGQWVAIVGGVVNTLITTSTRM